MSMPYNGLLWLTSRTGKRSEGNGFEGRSSGSLTNRSRILISSNLSIIAILIRSIVDALFLRSLMRNRLEVMRQAWLMVVDRQRDVILRLIGSLMLPYLPLHYPCIFRKLKC